MKKVGKGILVFLLVLLVCSPLILIGWGRSMLHDSEVPKREELIPSSPQKRVLAIFPHPDDEVTVAGTVMGLKAEGHQVTLVCLTRGEKEMRPTFLRSKNWLACARVKCSKALRF